MTSPLDSQAVSEDSSLQSSGSQIVLVGVLEFDAEPVPNRPINIAAAEIIDQNDSSRAIPQQWTTCTNWRTPFKALLAGRTCMLAVEIATRPAYAWRVVAKGRQLTLRGSMDIHDVNDNMLTSSALR